MGKPPTAIESDLYGPVKAHLEALGFQVRGEVRQCDVVGALDGALIGVELKLCFGLPVLYQALRRLSSLDLVYVGVGVAAGRTARANWDAQAPDATKLCRMLGVGLMEVRDGRVSVLADPAPYQPRKAPRERVRLLAEFRRRSGDHNVGGSASRARMTAYREDALRCARALAVRGEATPAQVRQAAGVPNASPILRRNVYGWFHSPSRGRYRLTPQGAQALVDYADVVRCQERGEAQEEGDA